jgi:hypothetical protein
MTDTVPSQNIDLSSWDTPYILLERGYRVIFSYWFSIAHLLEDLQRKVYGLKYAKKKNLIANVGDLATLPSNRFQL